MKHASRCSCRHLAMCTLAVVAAVAVTGVQAQLTDVPNLTPPQRESARASQAVYDALRGQGEQDALPERQQRLFRAIEELVHTANEQQETGGPTNRSLQLDEEGLAEALEWVANEEAGAGSGIAINAAYSQFANVVRRLGMLQAGGPGFARTPQDIGNEESVALARFGAPRGGGASADLAGRWSGFVNLSFGQSKRDPTDRENAYDADQYGLTAGLDYRVSDALVTGATVSFSRAELDFDASRSIVGGGMKSNAYALSGYALFDRDAYYVNAIVTLGYMDLDLTRLITYPSNNPNVPDTDQTARSSTSGTQLLLGLGGGYNIDLQPLTISPFARLDVLRIDMDGYREGNAGPFNLRVDKQRIESTRSSLGVEGSYPVAVPFGVLIPQLGAAWHHEFQTDRMEVESRFVDDPGSVTFVAAGDRPDRNFYSLTASLTAILPHGIQTFAQAETVLGLRHTSAYALTAGVRAEF
ncbi:MAG: autotransporter outer membrane beta-barrel domain-containing protein [Ectothiorhodospiraceae bacterium]|nr:autotransporter outer membrane beta-barrel domain-containing protein [Ectothiorhodospiraceae bacterium]